MEIQKIFSNLEDPRENLYSVLITENELRLYNEIQKEFNSKSMKALRNAWELAAGQKAGIPKYISKGYKTIENPEFKESVNKEVSPAMKQLNKQGRMKHPDYSKIGKQRARGTIYDHGFPSARYRDSDNTLGFIVKR